MTRVVVVGDVMVDVVARLEGPVALGSDAPARIELRGGGAGANTATWLAAADASAVLVARVGDDRSGRDALRDLRAAGVDARLAVDPVERTGICVVLVAPDGERTMFPDPAANDRLVPADVPDGLFAQAHHLHVAGYALLRRGSRAAAQSAMTTARAHGMTVSVDPSSAALLAPGFLRLVEGADLLLPNLAEASALTGRADPERAAKRLVERVPEVVVTLGSEGALWTSGADVVRAPAAPASAVIDTTGAGDAFTAGFLAARLEDAGPTAALAAGCRLAGEAVGIQGARPKATA